MKEYPLQQTKSEERTERNGLLHPEKGSVYYIIILKSMGALILMMVSAVMITYHMLTGSMEVIYGSTFLFLLGCMTTMWIFTMAETYITEQVNAQEEQEARYHQVEQQATVIAGKFELVQQKYLETEKQYTKLQKKHTKLQKKYLTLKYQIDYERIQSGKTVRAAESGGGTEEEGTGT